MVCESLHLHADAILLQMYMILFAFASVSPFFLACLQQSHPFSNLPSAHPPFFCLPFPFNWHLSPPLGFLFSLQRYGLFFVPPWLSTWSCISVDTSTFLLLGMMDSGPAWVCQSRSGGCVRARKSSVSACGVQRNCEIVKLWNCEFFVFEAVPYIIYNIINI